MRKVHDYTASGPVIRHGSIPHWKKWKISYMTGITIIISMYVVGVQRVQSY